MYTGPGVRLKDLVRSRSQILQPSAGLEAAPDGSFTSRRTSPADRWPNAGNAEMVQARHNRVKARGSVDPMRQRLLRCMRIPEIHPRGLDFVQSFLKLPVQ